MERIRITRWSKARAPNESELRILMQQEDLTPEAWSNGPGDVYAPHAHPYNKVIYIVAGSIVWILPGTGEDIDAQAGDRLDLPRGVVHAARVGPQGVTCLEAHL